MQPSGKKKNIRKRPTDDDDAPESVVAVTKKAAPGGPKLSFDLADEGESFKVKKKKKKPQNLRTAGAGAASEPEVGANTFFPTSGVYTSEMLAKLRESSNLVSTVSARAEGESEHAAPGMVADAEAIRAARAQRERARRQAQDAEGAGLAGPAGADFIPISGRDSKEQAVEQEEQRESRLVREEDEGEEASVFEDQNGSRIGFGRPLARGPHGNGGARHAGLREVVEEEGEAESAVGGPGGSGVGRRPFSESATGVGVGTIAEPAAGGQGSVEAISELSRELTSGRSEEITLRLNAELSRAEETLLTAQREQTETQRLLEESAQACREQEDSLDAELRAFDFLQRAQAYTEDLLDCLNEKAPSLEAFESQLCDAIEERYYLRRSSLEVRLSAERARARQVTPAHHYWAPQQVARQAPPPATAELVPLLPHEDADADAAFGALREWEAARDARRARRLATGELVAAPSGWSSSEEDEDEEGHRIGGGPAARTREALRRAEALFADAAPEFCEVKHVRRRFAEWRSRHPSSYADSYLDLCLPTLLAPLVRLQLLHWRPLDRGQGSIEGLGWYTDLMKASPGPEDDPDGTLADAECGLLAQLVCKLALPRLKHAVQFSWAVSSRAQGAELLQGVRELTAAVEFLSRAAQTADDAEGYDAEEARPPAIPPPAIPPTPLPTPSATPSPTPSPTPSSAPSPAPSPIPSPAPSSQHDL